MIKKQTTCITLKSISKKYILHKEKPTLMENLFSRQTNQAFWALKDINLSIKSGEKVAIIGPNGSGKTTLFEIIAGITQPTSGIISTRGKIVSLIELSAGFHPELTGRENIYLNGLILGMAKTDINRQIDEIISFSGIRDFIDAPLYTYSSGMNLRLGFSIAVHATHDILLLDEHLSVGDQDFRQRSAQKIEALYLSGKTILLITHDLNLLKMHFDKIIWMEQGKIHRTGKSTKIIAAYALGATPS
jgi:ABC-type polysaccharide/polyol phosphate transport system ATPase subunit